MCILKVFWTWKSIDIIVPFKSILISADATLSESKPYF